MENEKKQWSLKTQFKCVIKFVWISTLESFLVSCQGTLYFMIKLISLCLDYNDNLMCTYFLNIDFP